MTNSQTHTSGWISVSITPGNENRAKQIREDRDKLYQNIFDVRDTDERWVGDLGEMVFNAWFKNKGVEGFEWIQDDAAGRPDFISASGIRIGVKTVKRGGPPKENYTAQVTAKHADEPIDQFLFMSYEIDERKMWILGGIDRETFKKQAKYYSAGDQVHAHYQIREGHEIYNIEIKKLIKPLEWIAQFL